ncbi:MAG: YcjX family protein [Pseudomonadota bacterium]
MSSTLSRISNEALITVDNLVDRAGDMMRPTMRLGVTGLSRAGKTVFITALIHNIIHGGRLPLFNVQHSGRLAKAYLQPQPDDGVPRFQYENHVAALVEDRLWPHSTRAISELRLTIEYESASMWNRMLSAGKVSIDIVDYPGEWLLDLPLLKQDFRAFSRQAVEMARSPARADLSRHWLDGCMQAGPAATADETVAQEISGLFADYLRACRSEERALSTLPPGRLLMPGDLDGSPALTFAPLADLPAEGSAPANTLWAMMERRFEAYKSLVVSPFFREHFARLDRQIILIDAMHALNAGTAAVQDLERALVDILSCFRPGRSNILSSLLARRIDRVLVAATKADHLHHESHDRLEAIVRRIVERATRRAGYAKAEIEVIAMAAVRSTSEAKAKHGRDKLPLIVGTPMKGENINGEAFDGATRTGIFPGDLPDDAEPYFQSGNAKEIDHSPINFVRFRPPALESTAEGVTLSLPHIRLDRALEFLLGDWLA